MVNEYIEQKTKRIFLHPLVLAAFFCCVVVYSGLVPLNFDNYFFTSGISTKDILFMHGTVSGNPVKQGNAYKIDFLPIFASDKRMVKASCRGKITVLVPISFVERFYPGKIYTESVDSNEIAKNGIDLPIESGVKINIYGGFNTKNIFYANRVSTISFENSILGKIMYYRALCRLQFKRLMFTWGYSGGFLLALLSGSREYIEQNIADSFRKAGLSHIMALSGMHLSLFSGIAVLISKKIGIKQISFLIQLIFILFFVWFAGVSPSLFRALLCSIFMLFSSCFSIISPKPLHILSIVFLIHAFVFPSHLYSQAFILSYGALAGILIIGEIFNPIFSRKIPNTTSSSLSSSLGAQIFTMPYSLSVFKTFTPVCTIATLVVSPLISCFMYCGLVCIVLSLILPFLSPMFSAIMNIIYCCIRFSVVAFAKIPSFNFN